MAAQPRKSKIENRNRFQVIPDMRAFLLRLPILLIAVAALQSCFVAKEYSKPEVVESENYRTDSLAQDSVTMAGIPWQELFTDPVLIGHIKHALDNNTDIRVALEQMAIADAYFKQSKWGGVPTLSANGQVMYQELANNSQFGEFFGSLTQYELSASASWEADIWGKIRSGRRASEASYLQSNAAHQAVKSRMVAQIASLYYRLMALDEQKRIAEESIANRRSSLETTKALKDAGVLTQVAVSQTEAQLESTRVLLVDLKRNIKILENAMSVLMGDAPGSIERGDLAEADILDERVALGYPAQLLRNRPDVLAAEYNLVNAFEMTNVARSNFYPSVRLSATGGFQSLDFEDLFSPNSLFANLVGSLAQPILNKRQIRSEYEASLSRKEIAYLQFRQSVLTASREVSDAMYDFEAASKKIDIRAAEYAASQRATDDSEALLESGFANYLEVLTARQVALNSQLGLIDARLEKLSAVVELYRSLGGGWR